MSAQASGGLGQQSLLATGLGTSGFLAGLSGTGMLGQQSAGGSSSLQSTSIGQSIGGGLKLGQTPLLGGLNKGSTLTTTTGQSGWVNLHRAITKTKSERWKFGNVLFGYLLQVAWDC